MDYYKLLQLDREPFSNSPDPDYFFQSRQHLNCMQKLELALRLKRGLNVVIGDVGTGKTTLCRQLIRKFSREDDFESHLILDPSFACPHEFLIHIHELICGQPQANQATEVDLKERIKQALFNKGVDQNKTVILIIDEGQKITQACMEILREFLNYETNTFKLLQIVIFAQLEFDRILQNHANFNDRINAWHHLAPMNFKDTRHMVHHRLKLSSPGPQPQKLFTLPALWAIYRASRGYPRKIIHLCHQSMLAMIIQNRSKAGWSLIQSCNRRIAPPNRPFRKLLFGGLTAAVAILAVVVHAPQSLDPEVPPSSPSAFKIYPQTTRDQVMDEPPLAAVARKSPTAAAFEVPATPSGSSADRLAPSQTENTPELPSSAVPVANSVAEATDDDGQQTAPLAARTFQPPASLGKLTVRPGDTLVSMLRRVYGVFRHRHLRAVLEANAHIEDPNRIDIGSSIQFPPLQFKIRPRRTPAYWVVLADYPTLPSAVQRVHEITKELRIPLQLMARWSAHTGLRFQLLVRGYFADAHEASNYIQALPDHVSGQGYVLSQWPAETILYSDPYGSGTH